LWQQVSLPSYTEKRILWSRNLCCLFLGRPTLFFLQSAAATLIAFPCWSIQLLYSKLPAKREGDNGIVNLIIWHFRNEKKPGKSLISQLLMRLVTKQKMRSRTQSPRIFSHSRSLLVSKIAKCKPNYIYLYLICQKKKNLTTGRCSCHW